MARAQRAEARRRGRADPPRRIPAAPGRRDRASWPGWTGGRGARGGGGGPRRSDGGAPRASRDSASARKVGTRRANCSAGSATWADHQRRAAMTSCCPHSVGVMQTRAATTSATVSSPLWPMPVNTGLADAGHGPRHDLGLERGEVRPGAAAADDGDDVAVAPRQHGQRAGDGRRRRRGPGRAPSRARRGSRDPRWSAARGSRGSPRSRGWPPARCAARSPGAGRTRWRAAGPRSRGCAAAGPAARRCGRAAR